MATIQKDIIWRPQNGGIVSDVAPESITGGSLFLTIPETGALNIRARGKGTNVSPDYEPITGNELTGAFAAPVVQNRIFRVFITYTALVTYRLEVNDANGTQVAASGLIAAGANLAATYTNMTSGANGITTALTAASQTFVLSALTTTSATTGYFDLEITTIPYWDYDLQSTGFISSTIITPISVIQEAVDPSMLGYWREIGSDSRPGDLFQFWTTRTTLPVEIPVTGAVNNGAGLIRLTVPAHGLGNNFSVEVKDVGGVPNATGIWIINVIDADTVDLLGSTFGGAYTSGGTLTSYIYGYGQITASVKDENTQIWTGTVLLRSKEFNFSTIYQIDCRAKRKQDLNIAVYFVDFNNNDRVFYYKGPYITDGALVINGGIYEYGTINEELRWSLSAAGFKVEFDDVIPSGGNVRSGNWYYYARFGTQNLSFTDWTLGSSRAVPVGIGENNGTSYNFFGNNSGVATPVQVQLHVEIPIQGLFQYVEIAAVNKLDGGFTGEVIGRYVLSGGATQVITHTGFEINVTNLNTATLNQMLQNIEASRNIELINSRAVKSHLKIAPTYDLSAWAEALTYSIERLALPTGGSWINENMRIGEYQDPNTVYDHASLMLNERYRFSIRVRWRQTGVISPAYWARDIEVNIDNAQPGCTAALPDYDLTDNSTSVPTPYSFFVNFDTPNLNFIIDGHKLSDLVSEIFYCRCEVDNPQVLVSGIVIAAVSDEVQNTTDIIRPVDPGAPFTAADVGEFPFVGGIDIIAAAPLNYNYTMAPPAAISNFVAEPKYGSLYAYDYTSGHRALNIQAGDIIRNYGVPNAQINNYTDTLTFNYINESNGNHITAFVDVVVTEGHIIQKGDGATFTTTAALFSKKLGWSPGAGFYYDAPQGIVVYSTPGQFNALTGVTDRGLRNMQHIRLIVDGDTQYGQKSESKYVFTGASFLVDGNEPADLDVFGGDCFTQKTWIKNRYPVEGNASTEGMGQGIGFYAQNRANFQFRTGINPAGIEAFPTNSPNVTPTIANAWLAEVELECIEYNEGYTLTNQVVLAESFDPLKDYIQDARNWIIYSSKESDAAFTDSLRVFPPLAIRVMDYTDGYITNFWNINERAIVIQQRQNTILNFNDAAVFSNRNGGEVFTADSGVMDQKGIAFSQFGSSHKWSMGQGKNKRGNDMLYGINTDTDFNIWRYGYDGQDNLSEMQLIASFCKNNFRFIIGKDNPAHEQGICFFSNQRYREVGWTFRGWKDGIEEWVEPEFHMEHEFDNTNGNSPTGDMIEVNGILYGTTSFGGTGNGGMIFSFNPATGVFTNLFNFTFGSVPQGYQPAAGLVYANGLLYGITQFGGANTYGTIFSIALNGTGFINRFNMVLASGATGVGEMIEWNGKLYGMAAAGGAGGFGVIYEFNYNTNTYTNLRSFTGVAGITPGSAPQGKLFSDGAFIYGLTSTGGTNGTGVLFQYNLTTYNVLHHFSTSLVTGALGGSSPLEGVTKSGDKLYGTARFGGLTNTGVLFEYDLLTLTYLNLHDFIIGTGAEPMCTPTVSGTRLFGTARTGGTAGFGVLWEYHIPTTSYYVRQNFSTPDLFPRGQMVLLNEILYGTTGGNVATIYGTIYSYDLNGYYVIGDVVQHGTTGFEQIPAFYIALIDNVSAEPPSLSEPPVWELVATTDNRYYSFFTLVYSELKDVFQMFMTPKPLVYWSYKDTFGSCRPVGDTGTNYEYDRGSLLRWFDDGSTAQTGRWFFDAVANFPFGVRKTFSALHYISEVSPERVECTTDEQVTFMDNLVNPQDMETREGETDMSIKNDATITITGQNGAEANPTGSPELNTSKLFGEWMIIRTIGTIYNRVSSITTKIRHRARIIQK